MISNPSPLGAFLHSALSSIPTIWMGSLLVLISWPIRQRLVSVYSALWFIWLSSWFMTVYFFCSFSIVLNSDCQQFSVYDAPTDIFSRLGIEKGEVWRVPTFLHLWREYLPGWLGKGGDVTIRAPPPAHFIQAQLFKINSFHFLYICYGNEMNCKP